MVVGGLVLAEFAFVAVAATADAANERLLAGVDSNVGDVTLPTEEPLGASGALVGKVSRVTTRVAIQLTPVAETLVAHVALERSFT